jgi:uncharacterized protein (TIGR02646 family)
MRAINKKRQAPDRLRGVWHNQPPQTASQARSSWGRLRDKAGIQQYLLDEQEQLCCYSELRADEEDLGYHIEHIENKSQNPQRTFDYTNLAVSAFHSESIGKVSKDQVFGGHAIQKSKEVDMARFVSCLDPDCQRFFRYLSDGRVCPASELSTQDREKTQYTIDLLNLNSSYLIYLRRKWWTELDDLFQQHQRQDLCLHALVRVHLLPCGTRLYRFFSLTRQFFGTLAENVLQHEI